LQQISSEEMRRDFRVMKDVAEHTRVSPSKRSEGITQFTEKINSDPNSRLELAKWDIDITPVPCVVTGRQLSGEKIKFGSRDFNVDTRACGLIFWFLVLKFEINFG
jgi:aubergine